MKIAVIGAGGVAGYFGARLAAKLGVDVTVNRFVYHNILPMELRVRNVHHIK